MKTSILFIFLFAVYNGVNSKELYSNNDFEFVDITSCLPVNYVKDGSVDYTEFIQKGLNDFNNVKMPDFPILINENGLKIKSNSHICFQNKSKVITKSNSLEFFATIWLLDVKNVIIDNLVLVGNRDNHYGGGEWGIGIYIDKSDNISINNPKISNCWGDGIYIGGGSKPSTRIFINKANIFNNRRNGITITNGENVHIRDSYISNSNGTPPMAGLCIEPNNKNNSINNINIHNLNTYNNTNYGIVINLNKLLSEEYKFVNIVIDKHNDTLSKTGLSIVDLFDEKNRLNGNVIISNTKWNNNVIPSRLGKYKNGPKIILNNISVLVNNIIDKSKTKNTIDLYKKNGNVSIKLNRSSCDRQVI